MRTLGINELWQKNIKVMMALGLNTFTKMPCQKRIWFFLLEDLIFKKCFGHFNKAFSSIYISSKLPQYI